MSNHIRPGIAWSSPKTLLFLGLQAVGLGALIAFFLGELDISSHNWWLTFGIFYARALGIAMMKHRYFAHRSFQFRFLGHQNSLLRLWGRFWQFAFTVLATSAVQKGSLWWAATHRIHHSRADKEGDPHSPKLDGVLYAHMGWVMARLPHPGPLKGFEKYWELQLLNRFHLVPGIILAWVCLETGGLSRLLSVFFIGTTALYHATFTINSLAHKALRIGPLKLSYRRYDTDDTSQNSPLMSLWTLGEGSHNNHHKHQQYVFQGEKWYEIDVAGYVIWLLQFVGVTTRLMRRRKRRRNRVAA